jgi:formylglycine-generating enzyme required for sulfatase activity
MDMYESSPAKECVYSETESELHTQSNLGQSSCQPLSLPAVLPWRFVNYTQAQQLCARAGKRLPTNEEWYKVAIGLPEVTGCFNDKTKPALTGTGICVTPTGVHNMVGNVWEWVDETIANGEYAGRILPESGYVTLVDGAGVVIETANKADANFGNDYAWVQAEGVRGILRGGFYGSGNDGGVFTQNMAAQLNFAAAGIGFRCVRDIW